MSAIFERAGSPRRVRRRVIRVASYALLALLLLIAALCAYHHAMLPREAEELQPPGSRVDVDGRAIHVYGEGDEDAPTLVLLSGAATIAPVYDFAPLYRELSGEYRTVVVEKAGYGYSDIVDTDRDVASLVAEVREALDLAGEEPPYILVPHSMSGLEALWWVEEHPDEVAAVVGVDMSTPESYERESESAITLLANAGRVATWLGMHRIPGAYPGISGEALTDEERRQQRLLLYRNGGNVSHVAESEQVLHNARTVGPDIEVSVPMLLFSSDGRDLGTDWVRVQRALAERNGARLVELDCGHAVHRCAPRQIAEEASLFLHGVLAAR